MLRAFRRPALLLAAAWPLCVLGLATPAQATPAGRLHMRHAAVTVPPPAPPPPAPAILVSGGVALGSWAYLAQPADQGAGAGSTDPVIADFDSAPYQTVTGTFQFGVTAGHSPNAAEFATGVHNNVDHVTCNMDGGPDATATTTSVSPATGDATYLFTIDATDVLNADGLHEIRCIVSPTTGRPLVLQGYSRGSYQAVGQFFADASNPYVSITTAPIGSNAAIKAGLRLDLPGVVPANTLITAVGGTCGAGACDGVGGTGKYPVNINLNIASGSLAVGTEKSFFVYTNGHGGFTGAVRYVDGASGTNQTNCGNGVLPDCLTIYGGIASVATAQGGNPGGGTVYLRAFSNYKYGDASASEPTNYDNQLQYVLVTPAPGVAQSDVVITGRTSGSTQGLKTTKVHLKDVTVATDGDLNNSLTTPTSNGASLASLWADNVKYTATSYALGGSFALGHYGGIYVTGGDYADSGQAVQNCNLVANATIHNTSFVAQACQTHISLTVNPEVGTYVYGGRSAPFTGRLVAGDTCMHDLQQGGVASLPTSAVFPVGAKLGIGSGVSFTLIASGTVTAALGACDGPYSITMSLAAASGAGAAPGTRTGTTSTTWLTNIAHTDFWITGYTVHNNVLFSNIHMPSSNPSTLNTEGILASGTNSGGMHNFLVLNSTVNAGINFTFSQADNFALIDNTYIGANNMGAGTYSSFTVTGGSCTLAFPTFSGITVRGAPGC
jgi:hypothetical protein